MLEILENKDIVLYFGYGFIALSVFIISYIVAKEQQIREAEEQLGEEVNKKSSNSLMRIAKPLLLYIIPMVRGKKFWAKRQKK